MEQHPIQLEHIGLSNIEFTGYRNGSPDDVIKGSNVEVKFSYAPYDNENKSLMIIGEATVGRMLEEFTAESIEENPFYLRVRLHGFFSVDDQKFDITYANTFAGKNAPILIYPYLREHVYSLAIRCGFPNVNLPLVVVPQKEKSADQDESK